LSKSTRSYKNCLNKKKDIVCYFAHTDYRLLFTDHRLPITPFPMAGFLLMHAECYIFAVSYSY